MAYFNRAFIDFFKGLAANNNSEWFNANRKTYTKEVKEPFQALVHDTAKAIGAYAPKVAKLEVKNAMFRINRDTRFSKDKMPYKLHMGAVVSPFGRKDMQYPGLYMHLSIDTCHIGGGMYMPSKENLERIRQHLIHDPKGVEAALNAPDFKSCYGGLAEAEKNKILPREFKEFGDRHPLLYNKQFYYMSDHPGEETILRDDLLDLLVQHDRAALKLNGWFKDALGLD